MAKTTAVAVKDEAVDLPSAAIMEQVVGSGDLSALNPTQRVEYYLKVCESVGLNPLTTPFAFIKLQGRTVLYAQAGAAQQLASIHNLSPVPSEPTFTNGICVVRVEVSDPNGRRSANIGAVAVEHLKGDPLANALMKTTTKALRRAVLAHCGLGMLDETEVETIPDAVVSAAPAVAELEAATTTTAGGKGGDGGKGGINLAEFKHKVDAAAADAPVRVQPTDEPAPAKRGPGRPKKAEAPTPPPEADADEPTPAEHEVAPSDDKQTLVRQVIDAMEALGTDPDTERVRLTARYGSAVLSTYAIQDLRDCLTWLTAGKGPSRRLALMNEAEQLRDRLGATPEKWASALTQYYGQDSLDLLIDEQLMDLIEQRLKPALARVEAADAVVAENVAEAEAEAEADDDDDDLT